MADNNNINVRNVYIELLNKMKAIEGVDIEYIDKLVQLLYDDINLIDIDVKNIKDLIPEDATTENQLVTVSDLPAAQVNADWNAFSGVAEILNKPNLSIYAIAAFMDWDLLTTDWELDTDTGLYYCEKLIGNVSSWKDHIPPLMASMDNKAEYSLIKDYELYLDHNRLYFKFYAASLPTQDLKVGIWYYY